MIFRQICLILSLLLAMTPSLLAKQMNWRSELYPSNWQPGFRHHSGHFLHDYSYAGYHQGQRSIPQQSKRLHINVTDTKDMQAINLAAIVADGKEDVTAELQAVLNHLGRNGGGEMYLPAGHYRIKRSPVTQSGLIVEHSNVSIRGEGSGKTFLFYDDAYSRQTAVVRFAPPLYHHRANYWKKPLPRSVKPLAISAPTPTKHLTLKNVRGLNVGDWVLVNAKVTQSFIRDHRMNLAKKPWRTHMLGPSMYRQVTDVDLLTNRIEIDIPTRFPLHLKYQPRIYKVRSHISEVGIKNLSIGMLQHSGSGFGDTDYRVAGRGAYEVNGSKAILFVHVVNGWIDDVKSYRPSKNKGNYHIASDGVYIVQARNITVANSEMSRPFFRGSGGNGYGFTSVANEVLFINNVSVATRHAYSLKTMTASGNVFYNNISRSPRLKTDSHMWLSHANLFDNMQMDGDIISLIFRPWGGEMLHGHTATEITVWNTTGISAWRGKKQVVESRQWGLGQVIGTQGVITHVETGTDHNSFPNDWVEGVAKGAQLLPESLYLDQLNRRLNGSIEKRGIRNKKK